MTDRPHVLLSDTLSRRTVMGGVAAVSGAAFLAACGGPSNDAGAGGATPAGPASSSAPAPASLAPGSSAPASSAPAAGATEIVALADVPVGGSVAAQLDGKPIIVSQPTKGKAVAFSAICTHKGCTVKPAGAELDCPCHGSIYNALTGANISGPAPSPLPAVAVKVSKGKVVSG